MSARMAVSFVRNAAYFELLRAVLPDCDRFPMQIVLLNVSNGLLKSVGT